MSTIYTAPVYGDPTQLAATSIFVRFKETKLPSIVHRVSDTMGAQIMLVNYSITDSMYTITYVNPENIVLKRIAYSRESLIEVTLEESVCRLAPPPKPNLSVVPKT